MKAVIEQKRVIPFGEEFMKDKKVNDNIYAYFQIKSYLTKDRQRYVYKKDATATAIQSYFEEKQLNISLSTVKRNIALFKKIKLITESKRVDEFGKEQSIYLLKDDFKFFAYVPLDTLTYLANTATENVIKIYAYLLNKYEFKAKTNDTYIFTKKELLEAIGYSTDNNRSYKIISDIILCLDNNGLIEYKEFFVKNFEENPTPQIRLTKVNTKVRNMKESRAAKSSYAAAFQYI